METVCYATKFETVWCKLCWQDLQYNFVEVSVMLPITRHLSKESRRPMDPEIRSNGKRKKRRRQCNYEVSDNDTYWHDQFNGVQAVYEVFLSEW